jgi:hypothetical protein
MRPIPASVSVTGHMYQKTTNWLNCYHSSVEKVFKQITAQVAYTGIAILSPLETLARGVYALFLKGIAQCKDQTQKKAFMKKHVVPAGENFLASAAVVGAAALSLKDNALKLCSVSAGPIVNGDATMEKVMEFYIKTFPGPLRAMGFPVP